MGEEPVAKGSSFLIGVLCLGDEIQLRDVYPRGAGHIAEMAADAEVNPLIQRRFARRPKSFSTRTRLLRPRKLRAHPRNRADGRAGGATDTNIGIIFGPWFFHKLCSRGLKPAATIPVSIFFPTICNLKSQI